VKRGGGGVTFGHVRIYYPSASCCSTTIDSNPQEQEFKNNKQSCMSSSSKEPYLSIGMDEYELMKLNRRYYFTAPGSIINDRTTSSHSLLTKKMKRRPNHHSNTLDVQGAIVQSIIIDKLQQKQSHGKEMKHYSNKECLLHDSNNTTNSSNINHIQNARSA
jgi:hypothetical protein